MPIYNKPSDSRKLKLKKLTDAICDILVRTWQFFGRHFFQSTNSLPVPVTHPQDPELFKSNIQPIDAVKNQITMFDQSKSLRHISQKQAESLPIEK